MRDARMTTGQFSLARKSDGSTGGFHLNGFRLSTRFKGVGHRFLEEGIHPAGRTLGLVFLFEIIMNMKLVLAPTASIAVLHRGSVSSSNRRKRPIISDEDHSVFVILLTLERHARQLVGRGLSL
jgi:hypothetical protein